MYRAYRASWAVMSLGTMQDCRLHTNFVMNFGQPRPAFQRQIPSVSAPADSSSLFFEKMTSSRNFEKRQLKSDS